MPAGHAFARPRVFVVPRVEHVRLRDHVGQGVLVFRLHPPDPPRARRVERVHRLHHAVQALDFLFELVGRRVQVFRHKRVSHPGGRPARRRVLERALRLLRVDHDNLRPVRLFQPFRIAPATAYEAKYYDSR
ncbi:MAG TPA: hypothetical protein DIU07_08695 [Rhodobacteraceae bacterium]|nr:hypothetical protein [Paracoccaceae bacterium]